MKEKTDTDQYLNGSFNKHNQPLPAVIAEPPPKLKKTKIELAGQTVIKHALQLATQTDLSYAQIARRLNKTYSKTLPKQLTKSDVVYFFKTNNRQSRGSKENG